jgi:uncharacterized membrane protein (DUF373 family)
MSFLSARDGAVLHRSLGKQFRAMLKPSLEPKWLRLDSLVFFNQVIDLLFKLLIFFVVLVLTMGLIKMFLEVWSIMVRSELKEAFGFIVTNLLTFFIILELFKSLVEYFREHRLKLTFIVDATLVFILREVMIGLYQHQSSPLQICALALLALVLGAVRTLAIVYSPMERRMVDSLRAEGKDPPEGADDDGGSLSCASRRAPVQ